MISVIDNFDGEFEPATICIGDSVQILTKETPFMFGIVDEIGSDGFYWVSGGAHGYYRATRSEIKRIAGTR